MAAYNDWHGRHPFPEHYGLRGPHPYSVPRGDFRDPYPVPREDFRDPYPHPYPVTRGIGPYRGNNRNPFYTPERGTGRKRKRKSGSNQKNSRPCVNNSNSRAIEQQLPSAALSEQSDLKVKEEDNKKDSCGGKNGDFEVKEEPVDEDAYDGENGDLKVKEEPEDEDTYGGENGDLEVKEEPEGDTYSEKSESSGKNDKEGSKEEENDEEEDGGGKEEFWWKGTIKLLPKSMIQEYEFYPPTQDIMAETFKDIVILYYYSEFKKNRSFYPQKNPFNILTEAFKRSSSFDELEVEDGYWERNKAVKFCTLRYAGMMLVRGVSKSGNQKEARVRAALEVLGALSKVCYILKEKDGYYCGKAVNTRLTTKEEPGDVPCKLADTTFRRRDVNALGNFIDKFYSENKEMDGELVFRLEPQSNIDKLKVCCKEYKNLEVHHYKGRNCLTVCKKLSPQYWRDKLLANGKTENNKFKLELPDTNSELKRARKGDVCVTKYVPALKHNKSKYKEVTHPMPKIYGPEGIGPNIKKAKCSWAQDGGDSSLWWKTKNGRGRLIKPGPGFWRMQNIMGTKKKSKRKR